MEIHDAIEAGGNLTVTEGGLYNCTATNDVQTTFIVVQVVLKGNASTHINYGFNIAEL